MSSQSPVALDGLRPESIWIAPWAALLECQNQVASFWLAAASGWPIFADRDAGAEEAVSIQHESSSESAEAGDPQVSVPLGPEKTIEQTQPTRPMNDGESRSTDDRFKTPSEKRRESRSRADRSSRKRVLRHPASQEKASQRTAPGVLDGLRDRSYSVKSAAVSTMTTNKRYRTQKAIPLLERIVDNRTIQCRNPKLRTAAKTVLHQIRQETIARSSQASKKG